MSPLEAPVCYFQRHIFSRRYPAGLFAIVPGVRWVLAPIRWTVVAVAIVLALALWPVLALEAAFWRSAGGRPGAD